MTKEIAKRTASQKKLTPKRAEFVRQYVLLRDKTKAAIAAGFSPSSASMIACQLMKDPSVRRDLTRAFKRIGIQYERQLSAAMEELFHCVTRRGTDFVDEKTGKLLPIHQLPERANAAIDAIEEKITTRTIGDITEEVVERKLKLVPKAGALDMAFKVRGEYATKETSGTTVNIDNRQIGEVTVQQAFQQFDAMEPEYREWRSKQELQTVLGESVDLGRNGFKSEILRPSSPDSIK
jgi:phage terminase small subunit